MTQGMEEGFDNQLTMFIDLVLKVNALERLLIKKGIFTQEEVQEELRAIGADLAGLVHTALLAQMDADGNADQANLIREALQKQQES